jgi:hypothetical protein
MLSVVDLGLVDYFKLSFRLFGFRAPLLNSSIALAKIRDFNRHP